MSYFNHPVYFTDRRPVMAEHHRQLDVYDPAVVDSGAMPLGFKFRPTDLELIDIYLKSKLENWIFPPDYKKPFLDVELYRHTPDELIGMHGTMEQNQESWYFFTPRERKYQNGRRPQRCVGDHGYWKAVAKDTLIVGDGGGIVGYKKVLDYYVGKTTGGIRSDWKMHEYITKQQKDNPNLPSTTHNPTKLNDWVLCKVYKNHRGVKRKQRELCVEQNDRHGIISSPLNDEELHPREESDTNGRILPALQNDVDAWVDSVLIDYSPVE